jgi:carotenoid cleavage dioxygenase-like enzyme
VPNTYEAGDDEVWAWVDALASIHSLTFDGSQTVVHQARDLESKTYQNAKKDQKLTGRGYMTPGHAGKRPTGGHVQFPCWSKGQCKSDPYVGEASSELGMPELGMPELGTPELGLNASVDGIFDGIFRLPFVEDPNVDVQRFVAADGKEMFLALTDQTIYVAFDGETLETVDQGPCTWKDCQGPFSELKAMMGVSAAHWKYDFNTQEHFNFVGKMSPFQRDSYKMMKYKDGSEDFSRTFGPEFKVSKGSHLSFVHSFHLTDNYFIVQQPPAFYSLPNMMTKCAFNASYYDADVPTEWHVLDRDSGEKVAHFDAANVEWIGRQLTGQTYFRGEGVPGSVFHTHTVNAFEGEDGSITMDFIGWPDMAIFYGIGLQLMVDNPRDYQETWEPARLTRCIVNGTTGTTCEIIVDQNFGLPNFNVERFQGRAYNFVYGTGITDKATSDFVDRLLKVDIAQRKISHVWSEPDCFVTEPVFVARPDGDAEDDGVLMSTIYDAKKDSSFLLLLNAEDFSELARVDIGGKIQAHYHGRFCKHYGDRTCVGS